MSNALDISWLASKGVAPPIVCPATMYLAHMYEVNVAVAVGITIGKSSCRPAQVWHSFVVHCGR